MPDRAPESLDPDANAGPLCASQSGMISNALSTPGGLRDPVNVADRTQDRADHGWIDRLVRAEGPGILRMLWRILGREQDVMDAYQDCFCKLVARKHQSKLGNPKAYAYRTAANIAIEIIRVRSRRAAHWEAIAAQQAGSGSDDRGGADADQDCDDSDRQGHERLREAIGRLPTHLRNVVVLRDLSHMAYDEVGRTLGIEPGTARVYRRHAVVKLAELLEKREASNL